MRRTAAPYGQNTVRPVAVAGAVDVSVPVAGFYRFRLHGGAVRGGVRLWFGAPHDPVTGEIMDRSHRWQAEMDGEPIDFDSAWPICASEPITEQNYREFVARREWAKINAPDSAYSTGKRYDPLSSSNPMPF